MGGKIGDGLSLGGGPNGVCCGGQPLTAATAAAKV